ncbi:MAG: hypothetical protein KDD61_14405 [Bdellovibrionales bacterium]|nr:hypothetical protein [Bdellovibrionales bacterium]
MFQRMIILILMSLLLVHCAELQVEMPLPVAEIPEVNGETWSTHIDTGMLPAEKVQVTSNAGARPPSFNNPETSGSPFPFGRIDTGIFSFMQLGLGVGLNGLFGSGGGSSTSAHAKIQLLGDPRKTAKKNNFSLAAFGNWGVTSQSNSGDQESTFGGGGSNWTGKINSKHTIYGASLGYRASDRGLIFLGYGEGTYKADGEIVQAPAGADPGGTYSFDQEGKSQAATVGVHYQICQNGKCSVQVRYVGYNFDWESLARKEETMWGANLYLEFQ